MKAYVLPSMLAASMLAGCATTAPVPQMTPEQRVQACMQIDQELGIVQQQVLASTLTPEEEAARNQVRGLATVGGIAAGVAGIGGLANVLSTAGGVINSRLDAKAQANEEARGQLSALQRKRARYGC